MSSVASDAAPAAPSVAPDAAAAEGVESHVGGNGEVTNTTSSDVLAEAIQVAREAGAKRQAATPPSPTTSAAETAPAAEDGEKPKTESAEKTTPKAAEWARLHSEKKALFAAQSELKAREAKLADFEKAARTDKLKALELLGYTDPVAFIKDVAENNGQVNPASAKMTELERELQAIKAEREQERRAAESAAAEAKNREALDMLNRDVVNFVKTDPKFSKALVSIQGGTQAIVAKMQEHFDTTLANSGEGQVLSFADAAAAVEKEWEAGLLKFAEHPRGREILQGALNKSAVKPAPASPKVAKAASAPAPKSKEVDPEVDGEKLLQEAMQMMRRNQQARREA